MKRALIVDDDVDTRVILRELLQEDGWEVEDAGDGLAALELLSRVAPPHVIVLDLVMPFFDGWQVAAALAADERVSAVPLLVMSADCRHPPVNATAVLRKPFELGEFLAGIERCVTGTAAAVELVGASGHRRVAG